MKSIQIPEELFISLCKYHLLGINETELLQVIENGLQSKLDAITRRELYSRYKDKELTEKERQEARKAYLDAIGMHNDYRWSSLEPPT